jgi:hypothetical protein
MVRHLGIEVAQCGKRWQQQNRNRVGALSACHRLGKNATVKDRPDLLYLSCNPAVSITIIQNDP